MPALSGAITPKMPGSFKAKNDKRQPSRRGRAAIAQRHAIAVDSIVVIVAVITARGIPPAQIPIARRRS